MDLNIYENMYFKPAKDVIRIFHEILSHHSYITGLLNPIDYHIVPVVLFTYPQLAMAGQ